MIKTFRDMETPAILGTVRIGERKGKQAPVKLDYFKIVKGKDKDGQIADDDLMGKLDPKNFKPTEIKIFLFFDEIADNFQSMRAMYGRLDSKEPDSPVIRKCYSEDGEVAYRRNKDNTTEQDVCRGDDCKYAQPSGENAPRCKPFGRLVFMIAESPIIGGVYQYQTTSWNSIRQIQTGLEAIYNLTKGDGKNGYLAGIPLVLVVRPVMKATPVGNLSLQLVHVEYRGNEATFLESVQKLIETRYQRRAQIAEAAQRARLVLTAAETPDEAEDVGQEFYHAEVDRAAELSEEPDPDAPELPEEGEHGEQEEMDLP